MMYWGNGGWGMMLTTVFANLLLWGLIITGIVLLVRSFGRPGSAATPGTATPGTAARATPQALLAERYARGEIDDAEYVHRMQVINGPGGG